MDINGTHISDANVKAIRAHYKNLIGKAAEANLAYGRNSVNYALALCLVTATVEAVKHGYGFKLSQEAHLFLANG